MRLLDSLPIYALILISFMLISTPHLALAQQEDKKDDPPARGIGLSNSDPLEVMIERIPDFEERVETCQSPDRSASFNDCLWEGDGALNLPKLPKEERSAIKDYLKFKKDEQGNRPEMGNTPLQMSEHVASEKDPAIKSLEDYFSKKLQQALYGDVKKDLATQVGKKMDKKKHKVVDQRVFHDIYENLVSKKVVSDISSYCIRVNYKKGFYLLDTDTKQAIEDNKDKLSSGADTHSQQWLNCFSKIKDVCYEGKSYCKQFDRTKQADCDNLRPDSHTKACAVMRSVRSARQALIANKHIMDVYKDRDKMSGSIALKHSNSDEIEVGAYDPNQEEVTPDKITTFSSGEILSEENKFSETNQEQLDKMAECYDKDAKKIIDPEACEEFLASNKNEQYRAVAEVSARSEAISQQIEAIEEEDDIRDLLKEEGRSDDEIDALIEEYGGDITQLRGKIHDRYDKEQQALIEEMSSLVEQTTTQGSDGVNPQDDLGTIQKIHKELTDREDIFKQTVHYTNVMASFLTIKDSNDEEIGRNTGAVIAEMKNSAFNPELNEEAQENNGQAYFENLTASLEDTKSLEQNETDSTNILLDVSKINEQFMNLSDKSRQPSQNNP